MSSLTQRNDIDFDGTVTDDAGVAVGITGFAIDFLIARHRGDAPLLSLAIGAGVAITDGPGGAYTASLTDAQANLVGTYFIEVVTTDGSANQHTVYAGYHTFERTSRP